MALEWQNVPVVMGQGEDTKTDPKQVVLGKFLLLENAQLNNPLEFQKRSGSDPLPQDILGVPPATIQRGQGLATYLDELVIADTNQLFSFSSDDEEWVQKGALTSAEVTQFSVNRNAYNNDEQDGALHPSGQAIYSWRDVGENADGSADVIGVSYSLIDTSRQFTLVGPTSVGAGTSWPGSSRSKCQVFGQWMVCFYVTTTNTLRATCVPIGNPLSPSDVLIAGNLNASTPFYDVCAAADGTRLLFVFSDTAGHLNAGYLTLDLTSVVVPTLTTANLVDQAVSIVGDINPTASPQTFFITYGGGSNLYFTIIGESGMVATPETFLFAAGGQIVNAGALFNTASGQPNAVVYFTAIAPDSPPYNYFVQSCSIANLVPAGTSVIARSVSLAAKPFIYPFLEGGLVYALCNYQSGNSGIQNTYFLIDELGNVSAKLLALGCGGFNSSGMLLETSQVDTTTFQWALTIQDNLVSGVSAPAQGQLTTSSGSFSPSNSPLFSQTGIESVACNFFDPAIAYARETLADTLHVTGGFLSMYDGTRVVEHGFHVWPEQLTLTQTTGGFMEGSLTTPGTYSYIGVYEWVDGQGNFHQSAPSIASQITVVGQDPVAAFGTYTISSGAGLLTATIDGFTVSIDADAFVSDNDRATALAAAINGDANTSALVSASPSTDTVVVTAQAAGVAGNNITTLASGTGLSVGAGTLANGAGSDAAVSISFPTLRLTQKFNVACVVYRTEANGTQFFRATDPGATYNLNDTTVDAITIVDTVSDTNILAGQNLYTFGGVVENVSAPCCSAINVFDNRLWVLPSANRLAPWFSKQVTPGTPVAFSDLFTFTVDPRGGDITAIAGMDLYEVFFKQTSIYQTQGSGPDATGNQNQLAPAALVTSDAGCSSPRSVVLMPLGLMFKSEKGIYLLDRGLGVHYIGSDVAAFNQFDVVAATLVSSQNQVRFLLSNNVMLVYDYFMKAWGHRQLYGLVDATVFNESYCYLQNIGRVMQDNPDSFADAGEFYPMKVQTSWLALAGISGWQRVKGCMLLGDYRSPHKLKVYIAYDYDPTPTQVCVIDATPFDPGSWGDGDAWGDDAVWGGYYPAYQFRINFTKQKCTAVQITIQDEQDFIAPGEGYALSNLTFIVGMKQGWRKVGIERVFGGAAGIPTEY